MRREKILVDIYLAFNLGDDMFLDDLAEKYPEIDFVPFHPGKNYNTFFNQYKNIKQFPYSVFDKIKMRLGYNKLQDYDWMSREYDGVLFLGGGIFREESYWKELFLYRENISKAFISQNKFVWFMGCNFGPFYTEEFRQTYSNLFKQVEKIHFRDKKSFLLFPELTNSAYFPDILWGYNLPVVEKNEKVLGISLVNPKHKEGRENCFQSYLSAHIQICKDRLEKGFIVRLFSFCEAEGDLEVAGMIQESLPQVEIYNYNGKIKEYLKVFGECSLMIAARFHANIIAIKYKIPLIPISYGSKTDYLLDDLDYKGLRINLENIENLTETDFVLFPKELAENMVTNSYSHLKL